MNRRRIAALIRKDLAEMFRDRSTMASIVFLAVLICILLPLLVVFAARNHGMVKLIGGVQLFMDHVANLSGTAGLTKSQQLCYALLMYFFLPFFLLIPVTIATLLSSTAIVGEREHRTLEGLAYAPLNGQELICGKLLASVLPSIVVTWLAAFVYGGIVNGYSRFSFGRLIFPNLSWILAIFVLAPLLTVLTTLLVLGVSTRVKTIRAGQSVTSILVLPIIGMVISQATGAFIISSWFIILLAVVLLIIDLALLIWIGRTLNIEKMILS